MATAAEKTRRRAGKQGVPRDGGATDSALLQRLRFEEEPLRAEMLSLEQLREHAHSLANWHQLAARPQRDRLLLRLDENGRVLEEAYRALNRAAAHDHDLPPAGVWLLENYYLVHDQIRMARQHLPRKYSMELPQLAGGASDGLPRVYDLALELISHVDGQIDQENLDEFVGAYQTVAHLRMGELWAVPIMLRLALIENLRRVALRVIWQQHDQRLGETWADRIVRASRTSFSDFLRTVGEMVSDEPALSSAFVARFTQRINGRLSKDNVAVQWLTQHLAERGQNVERLVDLHGQNQAADQLSMGNSITSLRALGALDWKEFVENHSVVERVLRQDPSGVYARMDFSSRDRYRHVVERLARHSALTEEQVARLAVDQPQGAAPPAPALAPGRNRSAESRQRHVGYYLVDRGLPQLEEVVGYRSPWGESLRRFIERAPLAWYLGAIALVLILVVGGAAAAGLALGAASVAPPAVLVLMLLLFVVAASHSAVSLVNWLCTLAVPPRPTVRLDFSEGIPVEHRTLVAVPTMLTSEQGVRHLVEQLEVRYLANQDDNLLFALVTDFADAPQETMPADAALLDLARREIERLNATYRKTRPALFFLFHRPRAFNPQEGVWMGEERKRGKLAALNRLLRTGAADAFSLIVGELPQLGAIRYVITLDTDTGLARDVARELVGCMAHPLNRPRLDPQSRLVVEGYGILQPRVTTTIPEANRSPYSRLFAGDAGIDPYTNQTSDVYQDLFAQGSFIGKGIYDVYAFEAGLEGRWPDNRVLSHDLIEGCFVRSGLVDDVELFEGFPSRLLADMSRRHRWIRGDWQIAAWLGPRVPTASDAGPNPLSGLSLWKIFDNLRRSLYPAFLLALVVLGWTLVPQLAALWTGLALLVVFGVPLVSAVPGFFRRPRETPWSLHLNDQLDGLWRALAREAIGLAILPYTAHCNLDAIARTLYRLYVSQKKLLEWTTANDAEVRSQGGCRDHYEVMWACTVTCLAAAAVLTVQSPFALLAAAPVLIAWLLGPAIAWRVSQPFGREQRRLAASQAEQARRWARQTWHYFDTYLTDDDHWLAPDNVQDRAGWVVAPRTSPTNIGMGMLADLAACDLGYVPAGTLLDRLGRTLHTLQRLERYRGHFYNWYDTRSLQPAEPRYISSVDSGNLWGALVVLRGGLAEIRDRPLVSPHLLEGLQDTLAVMAALPASSSSHAAEYVARLDNLRGECSGSFAGGARRAFGLLTRIRTLATDLAASAPADQPALKEWARALVRQCSAFHRELGRLAFWVHVPPLHVETEVAIPADVQQGVEQLRSRLESLDGHCTLGELAATAAQVQAEAAGLLALIDSTGGAAEPPPHSELRDSLAALAEAAQRAADGAGDELTRAAMLGQWCEEFSAMDFQFLTHPRRKLLAIGYNVTEHRRDNSYYDLLASEARLASFLSICDGQLPQSHWFALGRILTLADGEPTLLSWSGSMFEYLMPMLLMPSYPDTLLDASCAAAVRRQIRYGRRRGVPWGVSESCYNMTDASLSYRYRAFGVPGLGLERGLANHLVIAPYASALAAMLAPQEACANLELLERLGFLTEYGFIDAVDYTPERRPAPDRPAPCRAVMAHHSGMTLLALTSALADGPMQRRFLRDRRCQAHDLLLQERVPQAVRPVDPATLDTGPESFDSEKTAGANLRIFDTPHTAAPEAHLLSNGRYHVVLTNSGGGLSRWNDLAVTRWQEDATRDHLGQFCYLRDVESGGYWSNTYQPTRRDADKYQAVFSQGQVEYRLVRDEIDTLTQVSVSSEEDVEVRRLSITNLSRLEREIELTTYAEVVLATAEADRAHRAFSSLFVLTELHPEHEVILCTRRPRSPEETPPWMFHMLHVQAGRKSAASFETSRERFVGRGRTLENPLALERREPLSDSSGSVLDPVVSVRQSVRLGSEESASVHIITGVAATREEALAAAQRYRDPRLCARVFDLSRARSQLTLQHLNITEADAQRYAHLASALLWNDARYRAAPSLVAQQIRRQETFWPMGISGDHPIVLVRATDGSRLRFVEQLIGAHAYWHSKGLTVDLVLWVETDAGYRQSLFDQVVGMVAAGPAAQLADRPGGIFVRRSDQWADLYPALQAVARIVLSDEQGMLHDQIKPVEPLAATAPAKTDSARPARRESGRAPLRPPVPELLFFNGVGGFTRDGREYISVVHPDRPTPAPWCNVLANAQFGTVVSESNTGYTWSENAHEFRLTPWNNDAVSDPPGEAIYVRDDESGEFFSATPLPVPTRQGYTCRHGFGYSIWETSSGEIDSQLTAFVSVDQPAKFFLLTLKNRTSRRRKLSATCYVEWVLGDHRGKTSPYLVTEVDPRSGVLLARNPYQVDFGDRVAFLQASETSRSVTCDRAEFLGRNGSPAAPAGLRRVALSGKAGATLDPAGVIRCELELAPDEEREVVFVLGAAADARKACELAQRVVGVAAARQELSRVWGQWNELLGTVYVETPEPSVNVLANGWLMYQNLACRFWGRSGFYQSGGAFGFRDQLQDSMALLLAAPYLTRQHLLDCAARQFREGDVQHWWHPPTGRGVRTRISDDLLWLPLAVARYVQTTGDWGVLDEMVPYLVERRLEPGEDDAYTRPEEGREPGTLYEHCMAAIRYGIRPGTHGLPLMGTGDWNDGMNRVGADGKGESVWLAFFLIKVMREFVALAQARDDVDSVAFCHTWIDSLDDSVQQHGWDGDWYLRAFCDDGQLLGSERNDVCRIDSIPQSWAVIARAAPPGRLKAAMDAVDQHLVRRDLRLIQLLDPPFDRGPLEPGYIKGYPPGVRENGGQYTHAAVWTALAFAQMGDAHRAWECFRMINPVNRTAAAEGIERYKVEPYVMAADVYAVPPHEGRGGWTWYTGSGGWMYQLLVEWLLGLALVGGNRLRFQPCPPDDWKRYQIHYRFHRTHYHIEFQIASKPAHHVARVTLDGVVQENREVPLVDDGQQHEVVVTLGLTE